MVIDDLNGECCFTQRTSKWRVKSFFFARDTAWTKTKQLGSLMKGVLGVKKEERRAEVIRNTQDTHPSSAQLVKVKKK